MTAHFANAARLTLAESIHEGLGNLRAQGQRSILALLGILIGTAAIVGVLTIGHIAQLETLRLFRSLGVDIVQIHAMPAGDSSPGILDRSLVERLSRLDPDVVASAPLVTDHDTVNAGHISASVGVAAVTADFGRIDKMVLKQGRFIAPVDDDNLVAVVGAGAAQKLSSPGAPIIPGARVTLKGYTFTVVGVLAPEPFTLLDPTDLNDVVMVPLTAARRFLSPPEPTTAMIQLRPSADIDTVARRLLTLLANPTATLQVVTARQVIQSMNAQKVIHGRLLAAVGAISLLVGGIGVMNVMLMGVMERRREIGLRAAIGATPGDIGLMFLVEAVTLAFVGGLAGVVIGLATAFIAARVSGWTFSLDPWVLPLGPGVAALVGVTFGLWPAIKASRLSPIEALRAE